MGSGGSLGALGSAPRRFVQEEFDAPFSTYGNRRKAFSDPPISRNGASQGRTAVANPLRGLVAYQFGVEEFFLFYGPGRFVATLILYGPSKIRKNDFPRFSTDLRQNV